MPKRDPRTKLKILERVPPGFKELQHLENFVKHWLGAVVVKWAEPGAKQFSHEAQVMVVSDVDCILLKQDSDKVDFSYNICSLERVYVNEKGDLLLVPADRSTPACLLRPLERPVESSKAILRILTSMYNFYKKTPLIVRKDPLTATGGVVGGATLLSPEVIDSMPDVMFTTLGTVKELKKMLKEEGMSLEDATTEYSESNVSRKFRRRSLNTIGTAETGLQDMLEDLEEQLRVKEKQLLVCKTALRGHLNDHNEELATIKRQFHELHSYLNRVYEAFPNVRSSLGVPPALAFLATDPKDVTEFAEENQRLKARIQELERVRQVAHDQAMLETTLPNFRWNDRPGSMSPRAARIPSAEARRHQSQPRSPRYSGGGGGAHSGGVGVNMVSSPGGGAARRTWGSSSSGTSGGIAASPQPVPPRREQGYSPVGSQRVMPGSGSPLLHVDFLEKI